MNQLIDTGTEGHHYSKYWQLDVLLAHNRNSFLTVYNLTGLVMYVRNSIAVNNGFYGIPGVLSRRGQK